MVVVVKEGVVGRVLPMVVALEGPAVAVVAEDWLHRDVELIWRLLAGLLLPLQAGGEEGMAVGVEVEEVVAVAVGVVVVVVVVAAVAEITAATAITTSRPRPRPPRKRRNTLER